MFDFDDIRDFFDDYMSFSLKNMKYGCGCLSWVFVIWICVEVYKDCTKAPAPPFTVTAESGKVYKNYKEACEDEDFVSAHKFLEHLRKKNEFYKAHTAQEYIFDKEMMYLANVGSPEAINRITYLLAEIPVKGEIPTEGALDKEESSKYNYYINSVKEHNNRCNKVLDLAIAIKNDTLAHNALNSFKQNVEIKEGKHEIKYKREKVETKRKVDTGGSFGKKLGNKILGISNEEEVVDVQWQDAKDENGNRIIESEIYIPDSVKFTNADKDMAIKKYKQAVKDGVFKSSIASQLISDQQQTQDDKVVNKTNATRSSVKKSSKRKSRRR